MGMGIGRIPISKIKQYAKDDRLSAKETERFVYCIKRLDQHFMEIVRKEQEKANSKSSKGKGSTVNGRSLINTDLL